MRMIADTRQDGVTIAPARRRVNRAASEKSGAGGRDYTAGMKFRTEIQRGESKNTTGIEVPPSVIEQLGAGKRPAVKVTLKGYTYRSTVAVMGGAYMVGVSAEVREKAGVEGGEVVDVELELDTEPREVEVPADLTAALKKDAAAKTFFEGLSYSNKRRIVLNVERTKNPETRQRRIEKAVEQLRVGKV